MREKWKAALEKLLAQLKEKPGDPDLARKMAELYQKMGEDAEGAAYFAVVAEQYAADGFSLKAVALLKQVLRLDPFAINPRVCLAELHLSLGLVGEARAYFAAASEAFIQNGKKAEREDVRSRLQSLSDLLETPKAQA